MIKNNKILALIPARGKILELKKKNVRNFFKKPLIKCLMDRIHTADKTFFFAKTGLNYYLILSNLAE